MTPQEILNQLKELMSRVSQVRVDWQAVTLDTPIQPLGFDSLSVMDLAYDISRHFQIEFDLMDAGPVRTVGDVVHLIHALKNK